MYTNDFQLLERIVINPEIMAGRPIIKGTRLTVEYILNLLGHGATPEDILMEYRSNPGRYFGLFAVCRKSDRKH